MTDDPLTVGSLFTGIGGIDLGLEQAGFRVKWQCECEPYCRRVLAEQWPGVPCYPDVRRLGLGGDMPERVDVLCGGFPCQPASQAGRREGTRDERWLWPEFARVARLLRPRFVFVENVPGLLTVNGGGAFGEVLGSLAELGYDAEWFCLSAAEAGAPHQRKRLWIVAHAAGERGRALGPAEAAEAGSDARPVRAGAGEAVADADAARRGELQEGPPRRGLAGARTGDDPAARHSGEPRRATSEWWAVEPAVGRVADGVPHRVDRLRALGNAVVPACAELVGRRIQELAAPLR